MKHHVFIAIICISIHVPVVMSVGAIWPPMDNILPNHPTKTRHVKETRCGNQSLISPSLSQVALLRGFKHQVGNK